MTITVQKSNRLKWAIVVDETELRRLDEAIHLSFISSENEEHNLKYSIKCSDGSVLKFNDINSVFQENNSKKARIDSLSAYAYTTDRSKEISVTLGDRTGYESVYYSVTGNSRDWVFLTTSKLCDRFKNMKQWYTPIAKIDWWIPFMLIMFVLSAYANSIEKAESSASASFFKVAAVFLILISGVYIIPTILNKLSKYLFPSYIFSIGDGIKEHEHLRNLRGQLFWAVGVALIVGIFVNYLFMQ